LKDLAQLEEENNHLKFMTSIKKYDEDLPERSEKDGDQHDQHRQVGEVHNSTLQDLGFGPDEEDDLQSLLLN
jgi:hypothetical protein